MPAEPLTAFPRTEARLRRLLAGARLDAASLQRPLHRCDLAACQGMCCYDGIYLEDDEAEVIIDLARREAAFFHDLGLNLPASVVVQGDWRGLMRGPKTAVRPDALSARVAGFPAHFNDTACVFHLPDGRCGLQLLSVARGKHPWHYKPSGCWLHPLSVGHRPGFPIGLPDEHTDPFRLPDYPGFVCRTFCGGEDPPADPAYEALHDELALLGAILGRDLVAEATPPGRTPLPVVNGG